MNFNLNGNLNKMKSVIIFKKNWWIILIAKIIQVNFILLIFAIFS